MMMVRRWVQKQEQKHMDRWWPKKRKRDEGSEKKEVGGSTVVSSNARAVGGGRATRDVMHDPKPCRAAGKKGRGRGEGVGEEILPPGKVCAVDPSVCVLVSAGNR
jgi:hypothetical protein